MHRATSAQNAMRNSGYSVADNKSPEDKAARTLHDPDTFYNKKM